MDHNGVTLNITYLICAWQIYTYTMLTVYAVMFKTRMWPRKTRISNDAKNVRFMRAHFSGLRVLLMTTML